jgi:DNA replication and repair protein RecF
VDGLQGLVQIGTGRDPDGESDSNKRIVRMDGKNVRAQSDLAKVFAVLWLTPQMDNLFIEGGTARRKFLDRLVYSFDDEHASRVNAYETAMRERNRLLAAERADPLWLSALEQKMAEQAVAITVARQQAVEGVMAAMECAHPLFPKAHIYLSGTVEQLLQTQSALNAEETLRALLVQGRGQDAQAGRTLTGVHRSQLEVVHVQKNMPAERCSTGEQKALLVSIILAQANAGSIWHGRVPVLLLDEVSTHLDVMRRNALYEALTASGAQCWLTGTDEGLFDGFEAQRVQVDAGRLN